MIVVARDTCRDLEQALDREWLVTNGLGGYASGTVAGVNTRRYHGLLVAALQPPRDRTLMLARVDEEVVVDDRTFYLGASEYHDGTVQPNGYIHLEEFHVDGGVPTWTYDVPEAALTKTVWMEDGQNTTYLRYALTSDSQPITLRVVLFTTYRDFHHETTGAPDWVFGVEEVGGGTEIRAFPSATPLRVRTYPAGQFIQTGVWYWRYLHRRERERGLDHLEDLYTPGLFTTPLHPGQTLTVVASAENWSALSPDPNVALTRRLDRQQKLWQTSPWAAPAAARPEADLPLRAVVLAADQFVVRAGPSPAGPSASDPTATPVPHTGILAGYHWFDEWGRDSLIAVAGLLLVNGRLAETRDLLRRYASLADHGQVPNRLPDDGHLAEYNSVDATLWLFQALERYLDAARDDDLLAELFPTLTELLRWYREGTRFGIEMDEDDALLAAGVPGVQLTWMDAKVDGQAVTPRSGKAVEINALWYNALRLMDNWARRLGQKPGHYRELARLANESFNQKFWYAEGSYLYDVVEGDGDDGDDATLRPNQVLAIALAHPTLDPRRWDAVLDQVDKHLLTPFGLRTRAPGTPGYLGRYGGDQRQRDTAYHQGTVWPWLIGPYAEACRRAGRDLGPVRATLANLLRSAQSGGLGTIGEVFDGDLPHQPGGAIAQAWSVAEVLRGWRRVNQD